MSIGKVIETLETEIREYKRMIDARTLCLAGESAYGECQSRIDFDREIISLLRTHPDAQPNEPQGDGWISVEDRLPETGVPVLIHNPHWDYGVVANYAGEGVWMNTWYQRMTFTPTHWRPLPEPPKEENER